MKQRTRGFTLLELIVTLAIAAILLGLAVPAFGNFIRNARMTSAANDVMAGLHYARSEAIKRRAPVTLCTSANSQTAAPSCANSAFLTGWIVFVDNNGNGQWDDDWTFVDVDGDGHQDVEELDLNGDGWDPDDPAEDIDDDDNQDVLEPDVAEVILQQHAAIPATITARVATAPLRVTYLDTGFAANASEAQLVMCDARGNIASAGELSAARAIAIAATGRAGVTRGKNEVQALVDEIGTEVSGCTTS